MMIIKYVWEQYINFRQLARTLICDMPRTLMSYGISEHEFKLKQSYSFDRM